MTDVGKAAQRDDPRDREADERPGGWCDVYLVDLQAVASWCDAEEQATPRLSPEDIARGSGPRVAGEPSVLWRASRTALRIVLEGWAGPQVRQQRFQFELKGRPLLPSGGPHFSLSRSGGYAAIAVCAANPVGVDIEGPRLVHMSPPRQHDLRLLAEVLAGRPLPSPPTDEGFATQDTAFLQAWVRIEAVAKARGCGVGALLGDWRRVQQEGAAADQVSPGVAGLTGTAALPIIDLSFDVPLVGAAAGHSLPDAMVARPFPTQRSEVAAFLADTGGHKR